MFRKNVREKGKVKIRRYLQQFALQEKVALVAEPAVHGGMHHRRFQGNVGVVVGTQGRCYKVMVKDGRMEKVFIVHPVHLRRVAAHAGV